MVHLMWEVRESGLVLVSPEGIRVEKSPWLDFQASNNEAKYEAFITGL